MLAFSTAALPAQDPPCHVQRATVFRDPHLNFAHGGRADFRGRHNAVYNFLSLPKISVNVRTEETIFTLHNGALIINGTFLTEAHVVARVGAGHAGHEALSSFWASKLNEHQWGWDVVNGSCAGRPFKFGRSGSKKCLELAISMQHSSATFALGNWTITVRGERAPLLRLPCPLSHAGTFLCKAASLHLASPRLRHAILRHAGGTVRLSLLPPAPSLPPALSLTSASEKVPHQRAGAPPRHQLQRERRRTHPGPPSRDNRPVLRDAGAGAQWQDRPLPLPRLLCHQCPGRGRHRGNGLAVRGGLAVRNTVHLLALRCRRTSPSPSQGRRHGPR